LDPDSLFFLGDLFDGGREWGRPPTAEKRYKKYGNKYWMKEYGRFVKMFLRGWQDGGGVSTAEPRGKKLVASLPGNHDLGFATGIAALVKDRFDAYFGPLNRADIVGNHTFISLDTVSLSAMDQPDPATGGSGAGDGTSANTADSAIWKPVHDFLESGKDIRRRAIEREVDQVTGKDDQDYFQNGRTKFDPTVTAADASHRVRRLNDQTVPPTSSYPTILLTHVPLYRDRDTDCGPLRERGKSISIMAGYQYQNVLTPKISQDIISKLGAEEVAQVYSGDDHDYCEIEHNEFTGRIKEITVKSMSWAMGVRRPGFLAVSLWNPVDLHKSHAAPDNAMPRGTIQNHLCLLPDQLSIFIRYAQLLGVTLVALAVSTIVSRPGKVDGEKSEPLLPLSEEVQESSHSSQSSAFLASPDSSDGYLSTRSTVRQTARQASPSRLGGYGNIPSISRSSSPVKGGVMPPPSQKQNGNAWTSEHDSDDWGMPPRRHQGRLRKDTILHRFGTNVRDTAVPVLLFYLWILRN
jgi:ethanolamine phosphate phosphodiesterase